MDNNGISSWSILKQSFALYRKNIVLFMSIVIVGHAIKVMSIFVNIVPAGNYSKGLETIVGLGGDLIALWAYIALVIGTSCRYHNEKTSFKDCYVSARSKYFDVLSIGILYSLILVGGLILFVIPGIYWGITFSLFGEIIILEKVDNKVGPLKRSSMLIKGHFWSVFLLRMIFFVPSLFLYIFFRRLGIVDNVGIQLVLELFGMFVVSFSAVVSVVLLYELKERENMKLSVG